MTDLYEEGHEYVICPECGSHILLDSRENWLDAQWWDGDVDWEPCWVALNCDWEPCLADFDALVHPPRGENPDGPEAEDDE